MTNLNGAHTHRRGNTLFIALPVEARRPCGGCSCDWCKAHPETIPTWDTLAVDISGKENAWTVHFPDMPAR